jgi:hypothetical protein
LLLSHVFISYSHANKDYVERLVNDLRSQQVTYWYDAAIETGRVWDKELVNAIIRSSVVILVMSAAARQSDWVSREIQVAIDHNLPILPLLLDGDVFPTLAHIQFFSVVSGNMPTQEFYSALLKIVYPNTTFFIDQFINALEHEKGFERQPPSEKFTGYIPGYIGIRQTWVDINAITVIKADGLTHDTIAAIHDTFFQYLTDWKPPFFLARILKKTGVLCFIYEEDVSQEMIDWVKKQQRDTEEEGLVLVDGVRTTSWVITLNNQKSHSNTILLPMFPPAVAAFHPGKAWVESFLKRYAEKYS